MAAGVQKPILPVETPNCNSAQFERLAGPRPQVVVIDLFAEIATRDPQVQIKFASVRGKQHHSFTESSLPPVVHCRLRSLETGIDQPADRSVVIAATHEEVNVVENAFRWIDMVEVSQGKTLQCSCFDSAGSEGSQRLDSRLLDRE